MAGRPKGSKTNKERKNYVSNPELYAEILKSIEQDKLTPRAVEMLMKLADNCAMKVIYQYPEDREDAVASAIADMMQNWRRFDPTKTSNPFAYFTSVCTTAFTKFWRQMGRSDMPISVTYTLSDEKFSFDV